MVYLVKIMKKFKTNYEWEPFTSYRDITHAPLGYIAKFIDKKALQISKEYKLKYGCKVTMIYSKDKPTANMYIRKLCQYGYIRRHSLLWFKSHGTRRPISYYVKRGANDS